MEGFGIEKLLIILGIVVIMFGAKRVPEIGASIGKGIREFKRGMKDIDKDEVDTPAQPNLISPPTPNAQQSTQAQPEPKRLIS
jgi:sec-independent protein translocase protein TatA